MSSIVVLSGHRDQDALVLPEFQQLLDDALSRRPPAVVVDLRDTRFLSVRNAFALLCAQEDAAHAGIDFQVVGGRHEVDRVLSLSRAAFPLDRIGYVHQQEE
ncbi:STAS domain-containing protein [Nocardia sp. NBC_01388]|uniref:STAS domain-containing protein n=1 Tax=Nocardia sp. NBC_01388 TaxID=2903596 RepID=UPI003252DE04